MATGTEIAGDNERKAPMGLPWIVRFYGEEAAPDMEGRTLDDILKFNDMELEYHHDYIQVLFPLPEQSPFNPEAPVIGKVTRDAFAANESLRKRLFTAFEEMASFYGFDVSGDETNPVIVRGDNFRKQAKQTWMMRMNHNHLRITRIIRCLRILGLDTVAQKFLEALEDNANGVGDRSLMYWERAAKRPLHLPPDESNEAARGVSWLREDAQTEKPVKEEEAAEDEKKAEVDEPEADEEAEIKTTAGSETPAHTEPHAEAEKQPDVEKSTELGEPVKDEVSAKDAEKQA